MSLLKTSNYNLVHFWSIDKECKNVDRNISYNDKKEYYALLSQKTHEQVDTDKNRHSLWKFGEKTFNKNTSYVAKSDDSKLSILLELYDMYSWQLIEDNINSVVVEEIQNLVKIVSNLKNDK